MLGKLALAQRDLTASAHPVTAAQAVDIDPELARGLQNRRANREISALTRWGKNEACGLNRGGGRVFCHACFLGETANRKRA